MAMSISYEIDVDGDAHGVEMEPIVNNKKKPNLGNGMLVNLLKATCPFITIDE